MAMISRKPVPMPHATIIASPPGVGKTELASHYPKPLFMMVGRDLGLLSLINSGRAPQDVAKFDTNYEDWSSFLEDLDKVEHDDHGCETLVIDTISALQYYLMQFIVANEYRGDETKFMDYGGKGWPLCRTPWQAMLSQLDRIRFKRKMRIVCLAHTSVANVNNPEGENYHSHNPELHPSIANLTNGWADNVLFCNLQILTENLKGNAKAKAKLGDKRIIHVQASGGSYAKNRWGLREPIPMGTCGADAYANLQKAIEKAWRAQHPTKPEDKPHGKEDKKPETTEPQPTEKAPEETKPAETKGPAAPLTGVREGEPVPEFVATFLKRIAACKRFGVGISLWPDIVAAYDKAPESDQIDHYPEIIKFWTTRLIELADGDEKYMTSIVKRIEERTDLPTTKARKLLKLREPGDD
jgi:hypothetical protein